MFLQVSHLRFLQGNGLLIEYFQHDCAFYVIPAIFSPGENHNHGREFEVPENNHLLRCFQYLAPEQISYGRFCWNEDCQYCRIGFDTGEGTQVRAALSCKLMAQDGLRVTELSTEIRYCLRTLNIPRKEQS